MSRFYADIQGSRGEATRCGSSDIHTHIRGWNVGIEVYGEVDEDGNDVFHVYKTSGSNGRLPSTLIATVNQDGIKQEEQSVNPDKGE